MNKCPFCGKDIAAGVSECPHCKKSLELANAISKTIIDGIKPVSDDIKAVKDDVKVVKENVVGIDGRLKKIEALPLEKFSVSSIIVPEKFLGYDLEKQGRWIKDRTVGKSGYSSFNKEEGVNTFAKFLIAFIRAHHPRINDPKAKEALAEISKASLAEGAAGTGGNLVPDEFQWDIVQLARSRAHMLQICRIVPMTSDVMYIPTEATRASVTWRTEAQALSQSDPTFGVVTLTAKKSTAYSISSNELIQDSRIDIASILTEQFAYGMALDIDDQVLNGNGTPFSGLLVSGVLSTNVVTLAGSMSTITVPKLSEAIYKLSEGDLANARFMINRYGLHFVRGMIDSTNRPIMQPLSDTMPSTILGYPWLMSEKISNSDTASKPVMLFADFNKMIIGRRIGAMALEIDPYGLFDSDQTRFRMISRWAFAIGREDAFTIVKCKA
jgi:HK97 family phage major capsid protein